MFNFWNKKEVAEKVDFEQRIKAASEAIQAKIKADMDRIKAENKPFKIAPAVTIDPSIAADKAGHWFVMVMHPKASHRDAYFNYIYDVTEKRVAEYEKSANYDWVYARYRKIGPAEPFANLDDAKAWIEIYRNNPDRSVFVD